jgi:glycosyltransferase involved in cell wall biosynthesis
LALKKGVEASSGEIIFFCDADLTGLEPGMVDEIVGPVLTGKFDMFVGARNHQNSFLVKTLVLLEYKAGIYPTTGQRALRKEVWERLPDYYKRDYRVEVGLNYLARGQGRGFRLKKFPYGHTKKERKLGVLKGLPVKLDMYLDVIRAMLRARFVDRLHRSQLRESSGNIK